MHAKNLAAMAGWMASQAGITHWELQLDRHSQNDLWVASKQRVKRWHAALKVFHADISNPQPAHDPSPAIQAVVEEILLSNVLTRVWSALLCHQYLVHGGTDLSAIAHATHVAEVEVRHRANQLLSRKSNINLDGIVELRKLQARLERWTDLWLSKLNSLDVVIRFAFDPPRLRDFSRDTDRSTFQDTKAPTPTASAPGRQGSSSPEPLEQHLGLMLTSFYSSLDLEKAAHPANPDLNQRIASLILAGLPASEIALSAGDLSHLAISLETSLVRTESLVGSLSRTV